MAKGYTGSGHPRAGGDHGGTFYREGERVSWDVHDPQRIVVIDPKDERYARLAIEEDDPPATAAAIHRALGEG